MKTLNAYRHLIAILTSIFLVFVLKIGSWDLQKIVGPINGRWLQIYTPYFPGLSKLESHEIFSPEFKNFKKIVIIGSSVADSIGCDSTWAGGSSVPNAHYSCSIAYQMNRLIEEKGIKNWRVFNLARNGSALTPLVYVYSQLINLKPDIVIYGDCIAYYQTDNAGAPNLNVDIFADMDKIYRENESSSAIWKAFFDHLQSNGLSYKTPENHVGNSPQAFLSKDVVSLNNILDTGLEKLKMQRILDNVPLPPALKPLSVAKSSDVYINRDPGLRYMDGFGVIAAMQNSERHKFLLFFSPQATFKDLPLIAKGLDSDFGGYAQKHNFDFLNYLSMDLELGVDTYDGTHQTLFGNRKIAAALVNDLINRKYLD